VVSSLNKRRDIQQLLAEAIDRDYIRKWAPQFGGRGLAERADAMNDTSATISEIVVNRYRSVTPAERWLVASSLFDTARDSST
jgi:hypothetical protein